MIRNKKSLAIIAATVGILFLTIIPSTKASAADSTSGFVKSNGTEFSVDGSSFYFAGTNNYYLPYAPDYMVDDVFSKAKAMNLKVMRTWGFIDGKSSCDIVLQPSLGVYDENGFKKFDSVIKKAQDAGIKLVIPFINNWEEFGGMKQYVAWTGAGGEGDHDKFFTNEACKTAYKNYVNHFLNRTNSITGVKYKDDPTIMTWELANEPRCGSDTSGNTLYNWVKEMSEYVKSIDSNHMVAVGDEGFFNRKGSSDYDYNGGAGVDWERIMTIPSIDYGTYHLYPDWWSRSVDWGTQWIKDHIDAAKVANKPAVLEEYGIKSNQDSAYKTWNDTILNNGGAGTMFWILTGVGFDGKQDYPDYDGFRVLYPSTTASIIMENAKAMSDKNVSHIGDLNDDGKINALDLIVLKKYLAGQPVRINLKNADINGDSDVDIRDLIALRKLI